jgi:GTPase Era involved in 16S rRNA processing
MSSEVVVADKPVFVKKKHELADLLKRVQAGSAQAVDLIVETMNAEEGVSLKTKLECAKLLLDIEIKVSAEISRDQLTRQIAEIKATGVVPMGGSTVGNTRQAPKIDFSSVQKVG